MDAIPPLREARHHATTLHYNYTMQHLPRLGPFHGRLLRAEMPWDLYPSSSSASLDPISIRFRRDKSSAKYIAAHTSHSSNHGQQKKRKQEKVITIYRSSNQNHKPLVLCTPENAESIWSSVDITRFGGWRIIRKENRGKESERGKEKGIETPEDGRDTTKEKNVMYTDSHPSSPLTARTRQTGW